MKWGNEMFICNHCGATFDDPLVRTVFEDGFQLETRHCPYCGSEDFTDAIECDTCGQFVPEYLATEGTCKFCIDESIHQMRKYMESGEPMDEMYRKTFLKYFDLL